MGLKTPRFRRVALSREHARARTRVRARAAYILCVFVQYRTRENVLSKPAPLAFWCFPCPEMNARPRPADLETRRKPPVLGPCTYAVTHSGVLDCYTVRGEVHSPICWGLLLLAAADGGQEAGARPEQAPERWSPPRVQFDYVRDEAEWRSVLSVHAHAGRWRRRVEAPKRRVGSCGDSRFDAATWLGRLDLR